MLRKHPAEAAAIARSGPGSRSADGRAPRMWPASWRSRHFDVLTAAGTGVVAGASYAGVCRQGLTRRTLVIKSTSGRATEAGVVRAIGVRNLYARSRPAVRGSGGRQGASEVMAVLDGPAAPDAGDGHAARVTPGPPGGAGPHRPPDGHEVSVAPVEGGLSGAHHPPGLQQDVAGLFRDR